MFPRLFSIKKPFDGSANEPNVTYLLFLNRPVAFHDYKSDKGLQFAHNTLNGWDDLVSKFLLIIFLLLSYVVADIAIFEESKIFPLFVTTECKSDKLDQISINIIGVRSITTYGFAMLMIWIITLVVNLSKSCLVYHYELIEIKHSVSDRSTNVYTSWIWTSIITVLLLIGFYYFIYMVSEALNTAIFEKTEPRQYYNKISVVAEEIITTVGKYMFVSYRIKTIRLVVFPFIFVTYYALQFSAVVNLLLFTMFALIFIPSLVNYYLNKPVYNPITIRQRHGTNYGIAQEVNRHNNSGRQEVHHDNNSGPQEVHHDNNSGPQEVHHDNNSGPQEVHHDNNSGPQEVHHDNNSGPQEVHHDNNSGPQEVHHDNNSGPQEVHHDNNSGPQEVHHDNNSGPQEVHHDNNSGPQEVHHDNNSGLQEVHHDNNSGPQEVHHDNNSGPQEVHHDNNSGPQEVHHDNNSAGWEVDPYDRDTEIITTDNIPPYERVRNDSSQLQLCRPRLHQRRRGRAFSNQTT